VQQDRPDRHPVVSLDIAAGRSRNGACRRRINSRRSWTRLIANRYGTAHALADAIGMSLSAFLRGVQHGSLSELNLLRLAEESGERSADRAPSGGGSPTLRAIVFAFSRSTAND
jgi:hypothetical protein